MTNDPLRQTTRTAIITVEGKPVQVPRVDGGILACAWYGGPCIYACSHDEQIRCLRHFGEKLPSWPEFKAWKESGRG